MPGQGNLAQVNWDGLGAPEGAWCKPGSGECWATSAVLSSCFCLWGGGVGKVDTISLDLLELLQKLEAGRQLTGTMFFSKVRVFVFVFFLIKFCFIFQHYTWDHHTNPPLHTGFAALINSLLFFSCLTSLLLSETGPNYRGRLPTLLFDEILSQNEAKTKSVTSLLWYCWLPKWGLCEKKKKVIFRY